MVCRVRCCIKKSKGTISDTKHLERLRPTELRVFTKVVEAALVPLRERSVHILSYLDDWLILAQPCRQLCAHRDLVLKHFSLLGLRVNWEKSKLVPMQRISFLGMELNLVNQTGTPHPGTCSVGAELLQDFIRQDGGSTETLSEAPGAYGCSCGDSPARSAPYETASALAPWRIPRWAWKRGTHRVQIKPACHKTFSPWSDPSFLWAGVPLKQVSRHAVVFTDASATGWGATYNWHAGLVSSSILAQQDLVPGTHAPRDSPSLADSSEEGSAFSETGHPLAPTSGPVETPRMVP